MLRIFGWLLIVGAVLGALGELLGLEFPTVRFPFAISRDLGWLHFSGEGNTVGFLWFGWLYTLIAFGVGLVLVIRFAKGVRFTPLMERRIERFKSIKRGYWSLWIIGLLAALAAFDHILVGNEALVVKYQGEWSFPAFTRDIEPAEKYGVEGDAARAPADYRELSREFEKADGGDFVMMPLIPYAPTGDNVGPLAVPLDQPDAEGRLSENGAPFNGLAAQVYDVHAPERQHLRFRFRNGFREGKADGWDREGIRVYGVEYHEGKKVPGTESWIGEGELADFLAVESSELCEVHFPPSPPTMAYGSFHPLGTNSRGYDVLAYLYGGLQVNFKAAIVYIPLVYAIGVSIGLLMGFFGGAFDLTVQRIIETLSNMPFLFVVMIASTAVPERLKEAAGLWIIVGILVIFGWMGMTYYMRTSALKEKQRDYIAASRVIGASTPRILFRHLLPNSVAIIVTLVPFSISGLVLALTSLDYLGFGVPAKYATWGQLLRDGLEFLSAPWLVTASFLVLFGLLILITFVGEAVREAFDPKKFSFYR
jgi:microcin C transport system permease protein